MTVHNLASPIDIQELAAEHESKSADEVIRWAFETFGARAAISTSFQAESMVVLDMAYRIDPNVRAFTIDTGRLPKETYDLIDRTREHYGIAVEVYYPDQDQLTQMVSRHGVNPFYHSPSLRILCCELRKVNPLKRVLSNLDAWVTGLRREQTGARSAIGKIEIDASHGGIIKVNPLADWTHDQVWDYVRSRQVPYNELYDNGYTSIGCAPCTRPTQPGEDPRAGRWWWENGSVPKECGIHVSLAAPGTNGNKVSPGSD